MKLKTIINFLVVMLVLTACSSDDSSCTEQVWYQDLDGDGFGNINQTQMSCTQPTGYVTNSNDFNDNDVNSFPNATEICDGIDNDNDGQIDGLLSTNCGAGEVCENGVCVAATTYYADNDGDGYGDINTSTIAGSMAPTGYVIDNTDCDDLDANNNPGAQEIQDGIDNDCDGEIDECSTDSDCTGVCVNGVCYDICVSDGDCPAGTTCVDLGGGLKVCQ
ncbi:putative metal-binding motif-containing protein [Kordia sp.]|uniref:putative metal-binding motif-containing protein n=1 Tax=Kordia sp. TaxID=1965332 RepID=UPI003B5C4434